MSTQTITPEQPTTTPVAQQPIIQPPTTQETFWQRVKNWFSRNGWIVLLVLLLLVTIGFISYLIYTSVNKTSMESDIGELITISETNKLNTFKPKSDATKNILNLFKTKPVINVTSTVIKPLPTPPPITPHTSTVGYQVPNITKLAGGYHSLVSTPTSNY